MLEVRHGAGDERPRLHCAACSRVHYENPLVHVGCIVRLQDGQRAHICLARVGNGERIQDAALRLLAQQGAEVPREELLMLYATLTDAGSTGVFLVFRTPQPLTVAHASECAEPWLGPLLALYEQEQGRGRFAVHTGGFDGHMLELLPVNDDREEP